MWTFFLVGIHNLWLWSLLEVSQFSHTCSPGDYAFELWVYTVLLHCVVCLFVLAKPIYVQKDLLLALNSDIRLNLFLAHARQAFDPYTSFKLWHFFWCYTFFFCVWCFHTTWSDMTEKFLWCWTQTEKAKLLVECLKSVVHQAFQIMTIHSPVEHIFLSFYSITIFLRSAMVLGN